MILPKNKWVVQYENNYNDSEIIEILHKIKGIDDYIKYQNLGFKDFYDPYLFKNLDKVIKKIKLSIRNNEKILIYGDYDVDGITATAILYRALKDKGADVHFKVPNRFSEGYGLSLEAVDEIIQDEYNLVITVDNGITSVDEIDVLLKSGISVIVTDHHEQKEELPHSDYIIHSYIDSGYPFDGLCGAGVSFKIAEALDSNFIRKYVDLVMLGTIADMMPVIDENKAIVNEGIKRINNSNVLGLRMLLDELGLSIKGIKDISFNIAPKINSLGRIGDASVAIDLLIEDDVDKIRSDIKALLDADTLRKELTIQNTDLAYKLINDDDNVILIYSPSFYEGVLGIIAQKVMKKTGKVTGVFNVNQDNYARGSFRTIGDYNILDMLAKNSDLLDKFGGHEKACGVSMKASNIKELKERLSKEVSQIIGYESTLDIALSLNHSLLTTSFMNELAKYDMQDTTFLFKDLTVVSTALLAEKHTKIKAKLSTGAFISIMVFNDAKLSFNLTNGDLLDVAGELNINSFNGFESLQIIAKDYKVAGVQIIDYRYRYDFNQASNYFDKENGLILRDNIDTISDLNLLIKEQDPSIVYLAPIDNNKLDALRVTDNKLLREAIYLISLKYETNEIMLQKELKISKYLLNNILTIFEELDLITRNNGKIQNLPRERGTKVNLENSKTYQEFKEQNEVLSLMRSDIKTIKQYVLEALE